MNIKRSIACFIGAVILWGGPISAGTIADLYDTGVGSNGVSLPYGMSPDPHYTIVAGSDGSIPSTVTVTPDWLAETTTSASIMPSAGYPSTNLPDGPFDYQTTFTLPAGVISVSISANLLVDDLGNAILLNGQSVGVSGYGGFDSYTPISFTSNNVIVGTNTLTFITANFDHGSLSPTGIRVDGIAGTYTAVEVPEPSTVALLGFASIGLLAYSRKCRTARMAGCTAIASLSFLPAFAHAGYVQFSNSTDTISITGNIDVSDQATYEAIVYINSTSYPGDYVDTSGPANPGGNIFTAWQWGQEDQRLGIGNGGTVFVYSYPVNYGGDGLTAGNLTTDVWYDLAYVFNGTQENIYVDGTLVGSQSAGGDIGIGSSNIMSIGAMFRDGGISPSFIGDIQSLRISDIARYSGDSYPVSMADFTDDPSTLLLYDFDQLSAGATSITDLSGNGHDGTFGVGFDGATSPTVVAVPEPASIGWIGFAFLLFRRRQDHRRPVRRM